MIRSFTILGEPIGEGRPRTVRRGAHVQIHSAPKSAEWRALAAQQMAAEYASTPYDGIARVEIEAVTRRPKLPKKAGAERLWRTTKPDVDNIAKACLDALVQGGVLADDRQVVRLVIERVTAAVDEAPRTVITVATGAP